MRRGRRREKDKVGELKRKYEREEAEERGEGKEEKDEQEEEEEEEEELKLFKSNNLESSVYGS